jgi:hypothetical protein
MATRSPSQPRRCPSTDAGATVWTGADALTADPRQSSTTRRSSRDQSASCHRARTPKAATRDAWCSGSSDQAAVARRPARSGGRSRALRRQSLAARSPPVRCLRAHQAASCQCLRSDWERRLGMASARAGRSHGTGPGGRPCRRGASTTPARARWPEPTDRRTALPAAREARPRPSCRRPEAPRDDARRLAGRAAPDSTRAAGRAPYCRPRDPASAASSPARCPSARARRRAHADADGRRQTDACERTPRRPPLVRDRRTAVTGRPA